MTKCLLAFIFRGVCTQQLRHLSLVAHLENLIWQNPATCNRETSTYLRSGMKFSGSRNEESVICSRAMSTCGSETEMMRFSYAMGAQVHTLVNQYIEVAVV